MLRVEPGSNGAFNVTEFGTVTDPEQFKALYAYSPYHNIRKGTAYPPCCCFRAPTTAGSIHSIPQVCGCLAAAQSADRPIFLRSSKSSGHGIGSSLDDRILEQTDELMFLFDQLGMDAAAAASDSISRIRRTRTRLVLRARGAKKWTTCRIPGPSIDQDRGKTGG